MKRRGRKKGGPMETLEGLWKKHLEAAGTPRSAWQSRPAMRRQPSSRQRRRSAGAG